MSQERALPAYFARVDRSVKFTVKSNYSPKGDQPKAIHELTSGLRAGNSRQVLLGVTGSGKTYTMANIIAELNRPALVLAHNKTLAAQLYSEFSELFPDNAVRYFVSYYDYYQPEAYVPTTDTYIEKDASINEEIDKLRHATTKALLERNDVIVVSSVSCIYGLGAPEHYFEMMLFLERGSQVVREELLRYLVSLQFVRDEIEFKPGTFRVRGDTLEICPASEDRRSIRVEFFADEIEDLLEIDKLTGKPIRRLENCCIFPASHFVTNIDKTKQAVQTIKAELNSRLIELNRLGKMLEAHRLEQRTLYDLELLAEMGFCSGIENYSRHLTGRAPGEPPPTLIDYFPPDFITFIDESHVTVPQLIGMYRGDRSRKQTLVDYGFRLPSALDNRPLRFDEFEQRVGQVIFVSATPSKFEIEESQGRIVEQIIRPTGLIDPPVEIRPASSQVDDFLHQVQQAANDGQRILLTTLTKKMAENLTEYYREVGVRVRYLHSDIHTLDRIDLIRALRAGDYDLLVGINLLREGLDLPEVALVGIMDADKEGFLRSTTSLIQTIGRASRNIHGRVILYADTITTSIKQAISETDRRRQVQLEYNKAHGITPYSVSRSQEARFVSSEEIEILEHALEADNIMREIPKTIQGCKQLINKLRSQMLEHASKQEFEQAAVIRDRIILIEKLMLAI